METVVENPESISVEFGQYKIEQQIQLEEAFQKHDKSCLLLLNQKINLSRTLFKLLWDNNSIRVCADGGANRLYDFLNSDEDRRYYLPNYIVGDLDSLRDEVSHYYHTAGVKIMRQKTQYANDFQKCITVITLHFNSFEFIDLLSHQEDYDDMDIQGLLEQCRAKKSVTASIHLLALGAIGGRFDQTMQSIAELYRLERNPLYSKVYFITDTDIIFVLPTGGIAVYYSSLFKKVALGNCGIIPFNRRTIIRLTAGLKWDVVNWTSGILDGKLSTSNRIVGDQGFYVDAETSLVMSIAIKWTGLKEHCSLYRIE